MVIFRDSLLVSRRSVTHTINNRAQRRTTYSSIQTIALAPYSISFDLLLIRFVVQDAAQRNLPQIHSESKVYGKSEATKNNKKDQMSLRKTRYSLYSFCCSTDLQGHPRSM